MLGASVSELIQGAWFVVFILTCGNANRKAAIACSTHCTNKQPRQVENLLHAYFRRLTFLDTGTRKTEKTVRFR